MAARPRRPRLPGAPHRRPHRLEPCARVRAVGASRYPSDSPGLELTRGPPPAYPGRTLEPSSGGSGPRAASCCRRRLSPRLRAGRGDHLPDLQAETGARVTTVPSRRAAPRGTAACLARSLRPAAWALASRGRAGAARVHALRPRRTRLRQALVSGVPDERALPVFVSRTIVLPVVREEEAAPVGGVAAEGGARARSASPRRHHHAAPPAGHLPQASGAPPRPLTVRRRSPRRVRPQTARPRLGSRPSRASWRPLGHGRSTSSSDRAWVVTSMS
jgi:hypothetical protein